MKSRAADGRVRMDNTNYNLLAIVGIVALTAIIAMFIHADRSAIPSPIDVPRVALVDGTAQDETLLTGNVVAGRPSYVPTERARPEYDPSVYDYDNTGVLDAADALVLADVVDRKRFCPPNKVCDLDGSGIVELRDLGLFNARLLEYAMARQAEQNRPERAALTGFATATASPTYQSDRGTPFWAAAVGAPVQ